jgi:hypothetical protein
MGEPDCIRLAREHERQQELTRHEIEVFARLDVAYDQALAASVLWLTRDEAQRRSWEAAHLHIRLRRVVEDLRAIRDALDPNPRDQERPVRAA